MKSVGQVIKDERAKKKLSLSDLEKSTKIKKQFLVGIEKEAWDILPDYPVLQGFVRSIGHALDFDENKLVATLRRDYPPKPLYLNPKPDIGDKFKWTPRLTFTLGVIFLIIIASGYLVYQYSRFVSPPALALDSPPNDYVATETRLEVSGRTSPDATILVNNQPFVVDNSGKFIGEIEISESTRELEVKATSRSGKESKIIRNISTKF